MVIKGAVGLWSFIAAQASELSAWDIWDQWYGLLAQIGAGIVGTAMLCVLIANFFKIRSETKANNAQAKRDELDWNRVEDQREAAHDAAQTVMDNTEPMEGPKE